MDYVIVETGGPPFEQVRSQIAAAIERGELKPAVRLPTVRQLAKALGLAPNTVARAYRELESAGLVETNRRQGTVVAGVLSEQRLRARAAARDFVRQLRDLGIGDAEIIAILRRELECDEA